MYRDTVASAKSRSVPFAVLLQLLLAKILGDIEMHLKELLWDAMGLIDLAQNRGKWRSSNDRHTMGASQEGLCSQAQKLGSYRCCYDWRRLTSQFENTVHS
jgi:hypothetical protein